MKLDFFKQENELGQLSIEDIKQKIMYKLVANNEYKNEYVNKEKQYICEQFINIKKFLVEDLNFKITKNKCDEKVYDVLFEFINDYKEYTIEFYSKDNVTYIKYKFENKSKNDLTLFVNLIDEKYELKNIENWKLKEISYFGHLDNQKDYELEHKYRKTETETWYLNEYRSVERIVEENKAIFELFMKENINKLFNITISRDEEDKEYTNIVDLIKEIIESE